MKIETLDHELEELNISTRNAWANGCEQPRGEGSGAKEVVRQNQANNENEKHVSSNIRRESDHSVADKAMQGSPEAEGNGMNVHTISISLKRSIKVIDKNNTLFMKIIPIKNLAGPMIRLYKYKPVRHLITVSWFLFTVNSLSICYGSPLLPSKVYLPLQVIYTTTFCLHHSIFIRVGIFKELSNSFNFWFAIWNSVSLHMCMALLWKLNFDVFGAILHSMSSIMLLILFDAHAGKLLLTMKSASFIGVSSCTVLGAILLFNLVEFENEKYYFKGTDVELIDVRLQAMDNLSTLIIYLLRIFYTHFIQKRSTTIAFLSNFFEIEDQTHRKQRHCQDNSRKKEKSHHSEESGRNMASIAPGEPSMRNPHNEVHKNRHEEHIDRQMESGNHLSDRNEAKINFQMKDKLAIGIMESKKFEYAFYNTIYHRYIHKYHLLAFILKSSYYNIIGIIFSIISLVVSFIIAVGMDLGMQFLRIGTSIVLIGIAFVSLQIIITSNLFMVRNMLRSFDYCYVTFLISKVLITSGFLCEWDIRMVSWVFIVLAFNWSFMIDTFHIKTRKSSKLMIIGISWMLFAAILCKLNIGNTFLVEKMIKFPGIRPISSRITLSTSAFSVALFTFRFLWSYLRNPNRVLFITENVRVEEVQ